MAFTYKLEHEDGTPADPATLHTAVPMWPGTTPDEEPVLVVEPA
jgi:hypothetical protein